MPEVLNIRREKRAGAIYIGRPSKWGNPFALSEHGNDRMKVISLYFDYLRNSPHLIASLDELRGKDLACFCAPALCHGHVLCAVANVTEEEREYLFQIGIDALIGGQ